MTDPEVAVCPGCGTTNPARAKFCSECATPLNAVATPAPREVRKLVTILFADVSGSTSLGEQLDAETLRALMGRYFAVMKRVIEAHGGTVEKFIGDAVMAVFGIPVLHEDDALRAVRAAADIRTELAALDADLGASRGMAIRFRTGLNTGEVVAGDPAGGQTPRDRRRGQHRGPHRAGGAAPGEILLGRLTYHLVRDAVTVEPMRADQRQGQGRAAPGVPAGQRRRRAGRPHPSARHPAGRPRAASSRRCRTRSIASRPSGRASCSPCSGTAGVGKSRLVAEFAAAVASEATILRGRCLSYGEGITYWPIAEIVRDAAAIDEADTAEAARARLRALVEGERDADVIAARVASAIGLSVGTASQEESFWAIRKVLEHVARERPARRHHRGHPLGRTDAARPHRAHRRLESRRADPAALPGAPGAARRPGRLGRRQAQRHERAAGAPRRPRRRPS